jgi:hypothetical protein
LTPISQQVYIGTSVGLSLDTGTDNKPPTPLSGWFLGFVPAVLNRIKDLILLYQPQFSTCFEEIKQTIIKSPIGCQFFHEEHRFFNGFEITRTDGSLILKGPQPCRSPILKYFKNQNWWFFINSITCTTLVYTI